MAGIAVFVVGVPAVQFARDNLAVIVAAVIAVVAVLVTTSRFTRSARQTAERTGIRLVDNATLAKWNAGTIPAPWT
ncbi:restriction endonuclease [Nocardia sp. CA-290969]|uniref:restriction endonuclease n=1 Tax=Nocardia sp. CA-290969 TaxID=3239986 RepID=UPI003D89BBEC